jgi:hypothetical protein
MYNFCALNKDERSERRKKTIDSRMKQRSETPGRKERLATGVAKKKGGVRKLVNNSPRN